MKKIILAMIMAVAVMVPVGMVTASPAQAYTCYSRYASGETMIGSMDPDGGDVAGSYSFISRLYYVDCGKTYNGRRYLEVDSYKVIITEVSGYCGITRSWLVNPDIIGSYNPGTQQRYCQNDDEVDEINWNPVDPVRVYADDPENERCLGGTVTVDNKYAGDYNRGLYRVCVRFN